MEVFILNQENRKFKGTIFFYIFFDDSIHKKYRFISRKKRYPKTFR